MNDKIQKAFQQIIPLENQEIEQFVSKFKPLELKKGDYFNKEGEVNRRIAYILEGCLYCVYNKNGIERVDEFSFENEFISDYRSFLTGEPADKDIICLEDSKVLVMYKTDLDDLYEQNRLLERGGRIIAESSFIHWQQKAKSLLLDNAETRYKKLVENRPNLPQRVPQYLVESYLGVSPETVRKKKKKIALQE